MLVPFRLGLITYHIQVSYHFIPFTVVHCIVLGAQPDLFPLSELWCTLMVPVIVLGHLLCCMGEGSFGFLLHL